MSLKSAMIIGIALGVVGTGISFASYARIESMGKNSTYVMDDISIFDNAANINIYPNYLIGEFGPYTNPNIGTGNNIDPQYPWFGGIFSLSLGKEDSRDPRLSIAGAFNRRDETLYQFLPNYVLVFDQNNTGFKKVAVPQPVTNFDGFLGGTLPNGNALGLHVYIAHQQGGQQSSNGQSYEIDDNAFASLFKIDGGVNWQFSSEVDGEFSGGIARIQYGPAKHKLFDSDLMSGMGSARLFSTWELINGELVPAGSYSFIQAPGVDDKQLIGGLGVNVALDRGFFWLGADYMYDMARSNNMITDTTSGERTYIQNGSNGNWDVKESVGGRISFGIERNIFWDWFVIRVGGMKVISYVDCKHNARNATVAAQIAPNSETLCPQDGNYFYTNPSGNGTWNDNVGMGFGINVEEKLKIDATVAEDVLFRNPFQGEGRILSRVSATYSF